MVLVLVLDLDLVLVLAQVLHGHVRMHFRDLIVYQQAVKILPLAMEIAAGLPRVHADLADQIRRASLSVSANIAEGCGKTTRPDQRRFFAIARGSAMECAALVDACIALNLVKKDRGAAANDLLTSVVRMLTKLCRA